MKKVKFLFPLIFSSLLLISCSKDNEAEEAEEIHPLAGYWTLASEAGSLAVGEASGNYNWWSISAEDLTTRACLLDDVFELDNDGTFSIQMDGSTWIEGWQGGSDACGTPVAPHNGSQSGQWAATATELTISGQGQYMGLPKVHNTGEDGAPANNQITYNYSLSADQNTLELTISGWLPDVAGATWYFKFTRQQ
jgi:hypothetical protein